MRLWTRLSLVLRTASNGKLGSGLETRPHPCQISQWMRCMHVTMVTGSFLHAVCTIPWGNLGSCPESGGYYWTLFLSQSWTSSFPTTMELSSFTGSGGTTWCWRSCACCCCSFCSMERACSACITGYRSTKLCGEICNSIHSRLSYPYTPTSHCPLCLPPSTSHCPLCLPHPAYWPMSCNPRLSCSFYSNLNSNHFSHSPCSHTSLSMM